MSLLVCQHAETEGPAVLGQVLRDHGHRLRFVHLYDGDALPPANDLDDIDGLVIMGGPQNVDQVDRYPWLADEMAIIRSAHAAGLPIVGICLGAQLIAAALGGKVAAMPAPEVGWLDIRQSFFGSIDTLHAGVPWVTTQFHLHGQQVVEPPPGAQVLAGSKACKVQAFKVGFRTYGFQYHFECGRDEIMVFAQDALVTSAGVEPSTIREETPPLFPSYRRLGDRQCENLATYLFPIDKRAN